MRIFRYGIPYPYKNNSMNITAHLEDC